MAGKRKKAVSQAASKDGGRSNRAPARTSRKQSPSASQENRRNVEELAQLSGDLLNLLGDMDVATLFLDRELRLLRFTGRAGDLFDVRSTDRGRSILELKHCLDYDELQQDVEQVLERGAPVEREVSDQAGRWRLTRVLPYRQGEDDVRGVVVTFLDVTDRKRSEEILRQAKETSERIVDSILHPMLILDETLRVATANHAFCQTFRIAAQQAVGCTVFELGDGEWAISPLREALQQLVRNKNGVLEPLELEHVFEHLGRRTMLFNARWVQSADLILLSIEDVTEQRIARRRETAILALHESLRATADPLQMMQAAVDQLGEALNASRVVYADLDVERDNATTTAEYIADVESAKGTHSLERFGPLVLAQLFENKTLAIDDVVRNELSKDHLEAFQAFDVSAILCVPRVRDGKLIAVLAVAQSTPRVWQRDEVLLVEKFATRTWAAVEVARAEAQLRKLNSSLEKQVEARIRAFNVLRDVAVAANKAKSVREAMSDALRRICQHNDWRMGHAYEVDAHSRQDDIPATWFASAMWDRNEFESFKRISETRNLVEEPSLIRTVVQTGEVCWTDDFQGTGDCRLAEAKELGIQSAIAFPVCADGEIVAVLEFFSPEVIAREDQFMEAMPNIGIQLGHVVIRSRLERAIDRAATEQQRQISQELHDNVGQELTGLKYIVQNLIRQLDASDASASLRELAQRLSSGLAEVHKQLRGLIRGMFPVNVDEEGLAAALDELAQSTSDFYGIRCEFHGRRDLDLAVGNAATQLYRIAHEAVNNAVKHASATEVVIQLERTPHFVQASVSDDGKGLPDAHRQGMGIRIMRHRASLIGAELIIQSAPGRGTTVACQLPVRS